MRECPDAISIFIIPPSMEELEKRRSENKYIENIMGFISIVCSNKFADRQRELYKLKDPETGEGYIPISLETPREDGTTLGSNIGGNPHYKPWDDARRQFAATAVLIYALRFRRSRVLHCFMQDCCRIFGALLTITKPHP